MMVDVVVPGLAARSTDIGEVVRVDPVSVAALALWGMALKAMAASKIRHAKDSDLVIEESFTAMVTRVMVSFCVLYAKLS